MRITGTVLTEAQLAHCSWQQEWLKQTEHLHPVPRGPLYG